MRRFGLTRFVLGTGALAVVAFLAFGVSGALANDFQLLVGKGCVSPVYVGDPYQCHSNIQNKDVAGDDYVIQSLSDTVNSSAGAVVTDLFASHTALVFHDNNGSSPVSCTNGSGSGTVADPFIPTSLTTCTLPGDTGGGLDGGGITVGDPNTSDYTVLPGDFTANPLHLLSDQITYDVTDACNVTPAGCDPALVNPENATGAAAVQKRGASASTTIVDAGGNPVLTVALGSTVHDSGTVVENTNPAPIVPGPVPTGTVSIKFFQGGTCTGTVLDTGTATLDGNGAFNATGMPETLTAAGQFSFQATYNGDGFYNASPAGACEPLTVTPKSPGITTTLSSSTAVAGATVHDSATLSGASPNAGGHVTYTVYSNASCSTKFADGGTVTVTNGTVPNSNGVQFSAAGIYYWQASYSGDANNNPALSRCTDEELLVAPATPSITTLLSQNAVEPGSTVSDSATLSGATANAGGTVTYTVYSDSSCSTKFADGGTVIVTGGSVPNSNGVPFTAPGTYYWQASYSGDANNKPAASTCTDEVLQVAPFAVTFCVKINKVTPTQIFVGRNTRVTIHLTKDNKPVRGIKVQIKGPKINVKTKASNGKGVITDTLKMKKAGILIFTPVATPHCNAKRIGVTGVFTPPVTG